MADEQAQPTNLLEALEEFAKGGTSQYIKFADNIGT